jgi:hypothetical protein
VSAVVLAIKVTAGDYFAVERPEEAEVGLILRRFRAERVEIDQFFGDFVVEIALLRKQIEQTEVGLSA